MAKNFDPKIHPVGTQTSKGVFLREEKGGVCVFNRHGQEHQVFPALIRIGVVKLGETEKVPDMSSHFENLPDHVMD